MTMSAQSTMSVPPAMHHPCTAAMVGFDAYQSFRYVSTNVDSIRMSVTESQTRSVVASAACSSVDQSRPYPAQKAGPSSRSRITRTSGSASASSIAAPTSSRSRGVIVLYSPGRARTIDRTPASVSVRIVSRTGSERSVTEGPSARPGPVDDRGGVDAGRQRTEGDAPVGVQPGRAERVGDRGVAVPLQQGALQHQGHRLDDPAGPVLDVVEVAQLLTQPGGGLVQPRIRAGRERDLREVRLDRLRLLRHGAQRVEGRDVSGAFPDRHQRSFAVEPRHAGLLDVPVAAQAFQRLGGVGRRALAYPVLRHREDRKSTRLNSS